MIVEVSLKLRIQVTEAAEADYYVDAKTQEATPYFIADIMDEMEDSFVGEVLSVNGLTKEQVQKKLQADVT